MLLNVATMAPGGVSGQCAKPVCATFPQELPRAEIPPLLPPPPTAYTIGQPLPFRANFILPRLRSAIILRPAPYRRPLNTPLLSVDHRVRSPSSLSLSISMERAGEMWNTRVLTPCSQRAIQRRAR